MGVNATHNLHIDRTTLFGREGDRERLRAALTDDNSGLLTLTGPGGIGKTRLALAVAHDVLDVFSDGVWFVELAAITVPDLVAPAIAEVLGVAAERGPALAGALAAAIGDRSMLLILDNFEQVTDAAPVVSTLVECCPGLKILVTSRTVLGLRGERRWPVEPLPLPNLDQLGDRPLGELLPAIGRYPAVGLFVDRAQAVDPSFVLGEGNVRATVELCRQLDGLPLALELAAGRARVLSPAAMLQRVDERLSLLGGAAVDRPERHRSLAATMQWSYDLLSEAEQILFRRLGVFNGGFTLEAVEAVCGAANGESASGGGVLAVDGILDALDGLIAKSLVRSTSEVAGVARFGLLEVLHAFAREKLRASGDFGALQRAHAWYLVRLVERLEPHLMGTGSDLVEARAALFADQANLRAALEWSLDSGNDGIAGVRLAVGLRRFWLRELFVTEGRRWMEQALATGLGAPMDRAQAHRTLGLFAQFRMEHEAAASHLSAAMDLIGPDGDHASGAQICRDLGNIACGRGEHALARDHFTRAFEHGRAGGSPRDVVAAANSRGLCWYHDGDLKRARSELDEALVLARQCGDDVEVGRSCLFLSAVALLAGRFADARSMLDQAIERFAAVEFRYAVATCRMGLATLDHIDGQIASAARTVHACLQIHAEHEDPEAIGFALLVVASLAGTPVLRPFGGPNTPPRTMTSQVPPSIDDLKVATRLTAAGIQALESTGTVSIPHERRLQQDQIAALRSALGRFAFESAWATGVALDLKGAVAEALAVAARLSETGAGPGDRSHPATLAPSAAAPPHGAGEPLLSATDDSGLSPRELEVALWITHGLTNREIAERMAVSVKAVEKHVSNILAKLGLGNRREIAGWGRARLRGGPADAV